MDGPQPDRSDPSESFENDDGWESGSSLGFSGSSAFFEALSGALRSLAARLPLGKGRDEQKDRRKPLRLTPHKSPPPSSRRAAPERLLRSKNAFTPRIREGSPFHTVGGKASCFVFCAPWGSSGRSDSLSDGSTCLPPPSFSGVASSGRSRSTSSCASRAGGSTSRRSAKTDCAFSSPVFF